MKNGNYGATVTKTQVPAKRRSRIPRNGGRKAMGRAEEVKESGIRKRDLKELKDGFGRKLF